MSKDDIEMKKYPQFNKMGRDGKRKGPDEDRVNTKRGLGKALRRGLSG